MSHTSQQSVESASTLPGLFVEPEWLENRLDDPQPLIFDVRAIDEYATGHLPGAIRIDLPQLAKIVDGVPGMALPPHEFGAEMRRLGLNRESRVILYDDHWGMPAARLLWLLTRYGHGRAAVLNGGWDRWREDGRRMEIGDVHVEPGDFVPGSNPAHLAERGWILARLSAPDLVLVDTRTPAEFEQGHIPSAINWDWMNGVPIESWLSLRSEDELAAELSALGITPDQEIVTYCRSGARAAHTYLLLRHLGYPRVRNYDGSWLEWSRYAGSAERVHADQRVGEEQ